MSAPISTAKHKLLYGNLTAYSTGFFWVSVTPPYAETDSLLFKGSLVGSEDLVIGEANVLESDVARFPILSKAKDLTVRVHSDHHLPFAFLSAEWETNTILRATRYRG